MEYRLAFSALIQNSPPASFVPGWQSPICIHRGGLRFKPCQHGQSGHCQHRCSARFHRRRSLIHTDRDGCKCLQRDSQRIGRQLIPAQFDGWNAGGEPGQDDHVYRICSRGLGECLGHGHGYRDRREPPPTVTMTASPTAIATGSSSTLTVVATNATQVTVTGSDGSSYALSATGGTQAVSPAATTTYTATATGAGGSVTSTATVTVTAAPPPPAPTVTISACPTAIAPGGSSLLTVPRPMLPRLR